MGFKTLDNIAQLNEIDTLSKNKKQIIFKHSTRCSVSTFAKKVLLSEFSDDMEKKFDVYYLDLLNYREVSNKIANHYGVYHESPQILIISDGKCIYDASHDDVSLASALASVN
ncbi:MAG TPA: bacillithiol system redox-active protein YtxJ [Bacteroidia bacterium]|nr:bacillithiol system redox-active protein YtxJ [Bacteroidia bacterium]MBP7713258.1 bacillithiol system redox-active protein YtxJ [Bacteroidia bacterium]MBP8667193.1 bacillithiol system redox-active protein YtxJ [Bacteroidia bacterium]HOZ81960.1 bacillithiol system redox-active protein YtxJ [Bacteroidia bacterium]HOZ89474.1 bacillithiol system redox-active protein YtxJ [Bacteroidia bacterium]